MTQEAQVGRPFAQYTVLGRLGRGGMGVVYKAHEESLGREVALKILPCRHAADPRIVERFQREARTSARLKHPNIAPVYSVGEHDGVHYIAMEYVQGRTLGRYIQDQGPFEVGVALRILRETADALREAHRNGILHRDIKPGNIMLDHRFRVKVMDFGLAQVRGETSRLTDDTAKPGTPAYMSPEQCHGNPLDVRTDIYSLGVTLYEMLTTELPFPGDNPQSIMFNITKGAFPDINKKRPGLPQGVGQLLKNMTATDPVNRYETARILIDDIDRLIEDPSHIIRLPGGAEPGERVANRITFPEPMASPPHTNHTKSPAPNRKARLTVAGSAALVVAAGAALAALVYSGLNRPENAIENMAPPGVQTASPAPGGLVAHWAFDEGRGAHTIDTHGGHRGVLNDATWTRGVHGTGIGFQGGESSYVEVPHSDALSPREAVTITAWLKVHDLPRRFSGIVFKSGASPMAAYSDRVYTLWLYREDDGSRGLHIASTPEGSSSQVYDFSTRSELRFNEFFHVAGVVDTATNEMSTYMNGEKVGIGDFPGDAIRGGAGPLRLGGMNQAPQSRQTTAGGLSGILDEVRIYNRALSTEEIRSDMRLVGQSESRVFGPGE